VRLAGEARLSLRGLVTPTAEDLRLAVTTKDPAKKSHVFLHYGLYLLTAPPAATVSVAHWPGGGIRKVA
jgi:hypothetical protein